MATTNVRYVESNGLRVRKTAAGEEILMLSPGDLMYDISGVATVNATLNGTNYVWIKVHYFKDTGAEGEGWVALENTALVSKIAPSKSKVFNSNAHLAQYEMLTNARYIFNYLRNHKWSDNAIYAILGNMEIESFINPGVSQNQGTGYGLVQWDKPSKYTDWLAPGADKSDIDNQLNRILYEVTQGSLQWTSSLHSPAMTFSEFTTSTKSCSVLAEYFLRCYEKPSSTSSLNIRKIYANKWSTLIKLFL